MFSAANKENNSLKDLLEKLRNESDQIKSENNKLINDNSEIRKNLNEKQLECDIMIQNLNNQHEAEIKKIKCLEK